MHPAADELRAALLAVLWAYISSFNSTNTSSLNLLMQQQQQQQYQSEANWAGSITGGPARSIRLARHPGLGGSVVSFAGSSSKQAAAAAAAISSAGQAAFLPATDVDGTSVSGADSSTHRPAGSIVRGPAAGSARPTVSFTGAVGPSDAADGWGVGTDSGSVMGGSSSPGSRGVLMSKAGRTASVAAGSEFRARGAGSVAGSRAAGSVCGSGRPGSAGAGPVSDCMSLHGALVLCKEVRAYNWRLDLLDCALSSGCLWLCSDAKLFSWYPEQMMAHFRLQVRWPGAMPVFRPHCCSVMLLPSCSTCVCVGRAAGQHHRTFGRHKRIPAAAAQEEGQAGAGIHTPATATTSHCRPAACGSPVSCVCWMHTSARLAARSNMLSILRASRAGCKQWLRMGLPQHPRARCAQGRACAAPQRACGAKGTCTRQQRHQHHGRRQQQPAEQPRATFGGAVHEQQRQRQKQQAGQQQHVWQAGSGACCSSCQWNGQHHQLGC